MIWICVKLRDSDCVPGVVLPILGALPDCLIIVVSGMGERDEAAEQARCILALRLNWAMNNTWTVLQQNHGGNV